MGGGKHARALGRRNGSGLLIGIGGGWPWLLLVLPTPPANPKSQNLTNFLKNRGKFPIAPFRDCGITGLWYQTGFAHNRGDDMTQLPETFFCLLLPPGAALLSPMFARRPNRRQSNWSLALNLTVSGR